MNYWTVAGTIRYLEEVEQALRLGSSVVIRCPGAAPKGFREVLSSRLRGLGLRSTFLDAKAHPERLLLQRFGHGALDAENDIDALHDSEDFRARLMWLGVADHNDWRPWCQFLEAYVEAARSIPIERRTLFVVTLSGLPPADPPASDAVRTFDWDDVVDEIDILSFANDQLRRKGRGGALARLLAAVVSNVAIWDFETAERLLAEKDEVILDPTDMLRSWARELGWDATTETCWHYGTSSHSGHVHAARAAMESPAKEIERRLWVAHASVLLPEIESRRIQLIRSRLFEVRRWLRQRQDARDPFDLEIGDLHIVYQERHVRRDIRESVARLRNARNSLAHFRPLSPHAALGIVRAKRD